DRRGNLWIGTYSGLSCWSGRGNAVPILNSEGTAFDQVKSIFEDLEGNIWIGTKEGLTRLTVRAFTTYGKQDGLTHNNVMSVCEDKEENLWIATWGGGLNQLKDGKITAYKVMDGRENNGLAS